MLDLGQMCDQIQALDSGDDTSRRQACHSLRQHQRQEWDTVPLPVIHSLVDVLQRQLVSGKNQPFLCHDGAIILGNVGPRSESAIPQLVALLQEGTPDRIREAAAMALGKIGKVAQVVVDTLIGVLPHGRTLAVQAVRALGAIGCTDPRVRTALVTLWHSSCHSKSVQVSIGLTLCKLNIDVQGLRTFLISMLVAEQDASLRTAAAEALAWCSKKEVDVVPALLRAALSDKQEDVRRTAEASLNQLGLSRPRAIYLCSKQLKDSCYAEMVLRKCGLLAVPGLIEVLRTQEPAIREKAIRTLGSLGEEAAKAVPDLTTASQEGDRDVRLAAAKALWKINKKAEVAVPVMVKLLAEKWAAAPDAGESRRRFLQTVIEALRRIGPPAHAAIPALTVKTHDTNRLVRESALSALREIAPASATTH